MKIKLITLILCVFLAQAVAVSRENSEWVSIFWYNANENELPRILLIGDSVCKGYQKNVQEELAGTAYTSYYATSKCVTDRSYLKELGYILDEYDYDVIHFNNGLHSLCTDPDSWGKGLREAIKLIKQKGKGAKVVWASSTPLKDKEGTGRVKKLNEIAQGIMEENEIPINDLFGLMDPQDRDTAWGDRYHFKTAGQKQQGKQIAKMILTALGKEKALPSQARKMLMDAESETGPDGKLKLTESNIIRNGGFEESGQWALYGKGGVLSYSESDAHSGKYSAHIKADSYLEFYQSKPNLAPGKTYNIRFWAKADKPQTLTMYIRTIKPPYKYFVKELVELSSEWKRFDCEVNLAETFIPNSSNLFFIIATPGSYWFDDVEVK